MTNAMRTRRRSHSKRHRSLLSPGRVTENADPSKWAKSGASAGLTTPEIVQIHARRPLTHCNVDDIRGHG
jgi:hypothetical protein